MRRYLTIAAGVPLASLLGLALVNYVCDPYLLHQWGNDKVHALRPAREHLAPWGKAYVLAVLRPSTIYLGNSRTELGLAVPAAAGQMCFNAAISGAPLGDALRMFRHARSVGTIRRVVWGIDAPSFVLSAGNSDLTPQVTAGGRLYRARRVLLDLRRSASFDMSAATLARLGGREQAVCHSSLAAFGQRDPACMAARVADAGGTAAMLAPRTREFASGAGPAADAMRALESELAANGDVRWRLYINPTHALTIDALWYAGKGGALRQWLGQLAGMAQRLRARGVDIRIYDFSGFNAVTTEATPPPGSSTAMQYFWEPSHYRANVGALILARLAGAAAADDGFGTELLPASLAAHLAVQAAALAQYRQTHPRETALAYAATR